MNDKESNTEQLKTSRLVGIEPLIQELFPDAGTAPSTRSVWDWKAKGLIPYIQIGARVFFDPSKVAEALEAQFGHKPAT